MLTPKRAVPNTPNRRLRTSSAGRITVRGAHECHVWRARSAPRRPPCHLHHAKWQVWGLVHKDDFAFVGTAPAPWAHC